MENRDLIVKYIEYQSIHPDRVVKTLRREEYYRKGLSHFKIERPKMKIERPKVERQYHNFVISPNSKKNIESKCLWLYRLAKSRTIWSYSGKPIYNFRAGFLTFTLPSEQRHPTSVILKECWERLLTQFRNVLKMQNYVWKLEFQKNGNVHFHLLTDTYIDFHYSRRAWNIILERLGYVSAYASTFSALSFAEYRNRVDPQGIQDVKALASRYAQGKRSNWMNPNSVDVRNVTNDRAISYYLSKYIAKESTPGGNANFDNEANSFGLRLAFWSRSLSRCQAVAMPLEYFDFNIENVYEDIGGFFKCVFDWCRVYYFSIKEMSNKGKAWFYQYFAQLRQEFEYRPAI